MKHGYHAPDSKTSSLRLFRPAKGSYVWCSDPVKSLENSIVPPIPYFFVDASYVKVRTDGRYENKALLIITGIHEDGYREILGANVADSEDEAFWESFFEGLNVHARLGTHVHENGL